MKQKISYLSKKEHLSNHTKKWLRQSPCPSEYFGLETDAKKMRIGMHPLSKALLVFSQNVLK